MALVGSVSVKAGPLASNVLDTCTQTGLHKNQRQEKDPVLNHDSCVLPPAPPSTPKERENKMLNLDPLCYGVGEGDPKSEVWFLGKQGFPFC